MGDGKAVGNDVAEEESAGSAGDDGGEADQKKFVAEMKAANKKEAEQVAAAIKADNLKAEDEAGKDTDLSNDQKRKNKETQGPCDDSTEGNEADDSDKPGKDQNA